MRGINSGHPASGGASGWVPFLWFVSLGKQRNEQKERSVFLMRLRLPGKQKKSRKEQNP